LKTLFDCSQPFGIEPSSRPLKKDFHRLLPLSYLSQRAQRERRLRKKSVFTRGVENDYHRSEPTSTFSTVC
jgi:hypothetical protein